MRRHDKEITDPGTINEILERSTICRLGFADNGEAYIVPVYYAYDNGNIYIHSARHGRKMELLGRNNSVSFEIELVDEIIAASEPCEWTARYKSLMGTGTITQENATESKEKALNLIMSKYGAEGKMVYDQSSLSRMTILVLKIESVTGKQSGKL